MCAGTGKLVDKVTAKRALANAVMHGIIIQGVDSGYPSSRDAVRTNFCRRSLMLLHW